MDDFFEIEQTFISESNDLLRELENDFLEIERYLKSKSGKEDLVNFISGSKDRILRNLHTLKGSSALLEKVYLPNLVHLVESSVKKIFEKSSFDIEKINLFLKHFDYIKYLISSLIDHKTGIDEAEYKNNIEELEKYGSDEKQPGNQRYDVFEKKETGKNLKNVSRSLYYIDFRLNEKRMAKTWFPEDIIDDISKAGRIIYINGSPVEKSDWKQTDFTQCHFGWTIILESDLNRDGIDDIFLFFRETNYISIEQIDEANIMKITEILKEKDVDDTVLKEIGRIIDEISKTKAELKKEEYIDDIGKKEDTKKETGNENVNEDEADKKEIKKETFQLKRRASDKESIGDELKISRIKIDQLIDLIGEMIIVNSNLNNIKLETENPELELAQYKINNISKQLRDITLSMKMVPIGQLLTKFHRMVRDLAREFGKEVELLIEGENTEVDKGMFSVLEESLLHILRNSIDHGIEIPDERTKKGKDISGKIKIKAFEENEQLVIEISDDGKGLDKEKIRRKGVEKNLLSENEKYDEDQIFSLIFQPGFSTSDVVNLVSGRGIGMDIVITELGKISGNIKVKSEQNKGTTFIIKLPLTLAIIEGFLIRIGSSFFVIPLNFILECFEIKNEMLSQKDLVYNLREKYLNIIRISDLFGNIYYDGISDRQKAVTVIEIDNEIIGILSDEIIGNIQVVIKPVSKQINKNKILLGSTLLGNGEVALILDVRNMIGRIKSTATV
jgi:two-component system, chemotaxis family, sensor kinase CheA